MYAMSRFRFNSVFHNQFIAEIPFDLKWNYENSRKSVTSCINAHWIGQSVFVYVVVAVHCCELHKWAAVKPLYLHSIYRYSSNKNE